MHFNKIYKLTHRLANMTLICWKSAQVPNKFYYVNSTCMYQTKLSLQFTTL